MSNPFLKEFFTWLQDVVASGSDDASRLQALLSHLAPPASDGQQLLQHLEQSVRLLPPGMDRCVGGTCTGPTHLLRLHACCAGQPGCLNCRRAACTRLRPAPQLQRTAHPAKSLCPPQAASHQPQTDTLASPHPHCHPHTVQPPPHTQPPSHSPATSTQPSHPHTAQPPQHTHTHLCPCAAASLGC